MELDGRFPNRGSDPTLRANQRQLAKELKNGSYDFGISFDGDSDRIAFLDEKGNFINSAAIGALISAHLLKKQPKAKIIYTILTSRIYEETIRALGGRAVQAKVGHAFIKEKMRQDDVLFGCEQSGHYYFKDYFYTDSVVMTLRQVIEVYLEAKANNITFSELAKPYTIYEQTEDVVVEVKDKNQSMKAMEVYLQKQSPKKLKKFDGLFVDFGDVWGVVAPSVTEQALKILFESKNKRLAQSKLKEAVEFAKSIALK
jgi:phosphomannomutase